LQQCSGGAVKCCAGRLLRPPVKLARPCPRYCPKPVSAVSSIRVEAAGVAGEVAQGKVRAGKVQECAAGRALGKMPKGAERRYRQW